MMINFLKNIDVITGNKEIFICKKALMGLFSLKLIQTTIYNVICYNTNIVFNIL